MTQIYGGLDTETDEKDTCSKKAKIACSAAVDGFPLNDSLCRRLLQRDRRDALPDSLSEKVESLEKLRVVFNKHGLRTSIVRSPREALSVYTDSFATCAENEAGQFLTILFGMHEEQEEMESFYSSYVKDSYILLLFCRLVRKKCARAIERNGKLAEKIRNTEQLCMSLDQAHCCNEGAVSFLSALSEICTQAVASDTRLRTEQLRHEYERIQVYNTTLSNALLGIFVDNCDVVLKDIYYKRSSSANFERFTIYFYDPKIDERKPDRVSFLPCLSIALKHGVENVVESMLRSFWKEMLRRGYFATSSTRAAMEPNLKKYFMSGLTESTSRPLYLNAHFSPTFPLSFYFTGKAGAGKSSLVQRFGPALMQIVETYADPATLVRFVKQNLNKSMAVLRVELDLRANNNDMSVMSIIQSRKMTAGQTKPGLVVVGLEEIASSHADASPNQIETARLISQRFAGRKGEFCEGSATAKNSTHRGIASDNSIVPLFTSNYELADSSRQALEKLRIFQSLKVVEVTAIRDQDRNNFVKQYLLRCMEEIGGVVFSNIHVFVGTIHCKDDTRMLVRIVRAIAFYVCEHIKSFSHQKRKFPLKISVAGDNETCTVVANNSVLIQLRIGGCNSIAPVNAQVHDTRVSQITHALRSSMEITQLLELSTVIDYWLARVLTPAVIVSKKEEVFGRLTTILSKHSDIHVLKGIDPDGYKMMKSLYDPSDTPNLRDDILNLGSNATVAIELKCKHANAEFAIRDMIEDTCSMTAFSSSKSALQKSGLLFLVHVMDDITPAVRSRASLVLS